ncbi:hypothetical protein PHYBOEH_000297 [Phytophthora boehmeriae]|uniref:Uncharacterized protein n=1 Tax=Phytophthora boehmeriae TaxID=109152 RepID=A0A8T1VC19_9STRA|nr:hypothetical protein PHYBOEH_000297 [Phytophthora boehmeriae]
MRLLIRAVVVAFFVAIVHADQIDYDEVEPFPETKPTTSEYAIGLKYQPQLSVIKLNCKPYPAVDADGNTGGGASFTLLKRNCRESKNGSQVYGRAAVYKDAWAIMYAWYFPSAGIMKTHDWEHVIVWLDGSGKDATLGAVTVPRPFGHYRMYAPPALRWMDGDSIKLRYKNMYGVRYLQATSNIGEYQDLVMWEDMTDKARTALKTTDFGSDAVPILDDEFLGYLRKAYPW